MELLHGPKIGGSPGQPLQKAKGSLRFVARKGGQIAARDRGQEAEPPPLGRAMADEMAPERAGIGGQIVVQSQIIAGDESRDRRGACGIAVAEPVVKCMLPRTQRRQAEAGDLGQVVVGGEQRAGRNARGKVEREVAQEDLGIRKRGGKTVAAAATGSREHRQDHLVKPPAAGQVRTMA